jgi:gamma-glutamyltranspeptidase/glutathione hydrolase
MRGAVAAGHPLSARVGADTLAQGGNAVDACVAAAFAAAVCESPLTGLGSGGFMLVYRRADRSARLLDCFVAAPGIALGRRQRAELQPVEVSFGGGATTQPFLIGAASVAVPGTVAGLEAAHRAYGRLPWRELVAPASALARGGVALTPAQAHIHAILDPILRAAEEGRRVYGGPAGAALQTRERLVLPDLADTLDEVGRRGAAVLYRGEGARATVAALREGGGALTLADLAAYRAIWRRPVAVRYGGSTVFSNPPPSAGGVLLAYGLALLARAPLPAPAGSERLAVLAEVMREQARARTPGFDRALGRGGLAARLLAPAALREARRRVEAGLAATAEPAPPGGTTHVSVIDAGGNAAAFSSSTGSGSGVIVPGRGIYLNNMLGEFDLVGSRTPKPGTRLLSMMAPTVALGRGGAPRLVLGSAGSARLRGAIMQVAANVLAHGLGVAEAIGAPRIHVDGAVVHCEGGHPREVLDELSARGYELVRWRGRNLFFGGVAAVELLPDGTLASAGDPRRGGAGVVVA